MIAQEVAYMDSVFGFAANKHDILFHDICSYTQLQGVRLSYAVVIHLHAAQQLLALHIEAGNAPPPGGGEASIKAVTIGSSFKPIPFGDYT